jgi:predicted GIY-YIG superfamily endonuclease
MSKATSWRPDPNTGLSGEQYLTEALEEFIEDLSEAHRPGIYVLELSTPTTSDYETHARLWLEEFDTTPKYLESIADTSKLLYVGAAEDVYERLEEHLNNPNRSTAVAEVFPIHSIRYIKWCDSPEEAFTHESAVATDLANSTSGYVHSR